MTRTNALSVESAEDYCPPQTRNLRHAGLALTNHEEKAKVRRKTINNKVERNRNTAHLPRLLPLRLPHPLRHHRHLLPNPCPDQNHFATDVRSRTVVSVESTIQLRASTTNPAQVGLDAEPHRHPPTDATEAGHQTIEIGRTDGRERQQQSAAGRGKGRHRANRIGGRAPTLLTSIPERTCDRTPTTKAHERDHCC